MNKQLVIFLVVGVVCVVGLSVMLDKKAPVKDVKQITTDVKADTKMTPKDVPAAQTADQVKDTKVEPPKDRVVTESVTAALSLKDVDDVFDVSVPAAKKTGHISRHFGCDGKNVSIPVVWGKSLEDKGKSIAIFFEKVTGDAETDVRWAVYNIPANIMGLYYNSDGKISNGELKFSRAINDSGKQEYQGPCDQEEGMYDYLATVVVTDREPMLSKGITRSNLLKSLEGGVTAYGQIKVPFKR